MSTTTIQDDIQPNTKTGWFGSFIQGWWNGVPSTIENVHNVPQIPDEQPIEFMSRSHLQSCKVLSNRVFTATGQNHKLVALAGSFMNRRGRNITINTTDAQPVGMHISGIQALMNSLLIATYTQPRRFRNNPSLHEHIVVDTTHEQDGVLDGGCSCYHVYHPTSDSLQRNNFASLKDAPILYLFCGLNMGPHYYANLVDSCTERRGWSVIIFNRRGMCERLQTPLFHVSGDDHDTRTQIDHARKSPLVYGRKAFAIGFSMGGMQLLRYLGRYHTTQDRQRDGIVIASTICSPTSTSDINTRWIGSLDSALVNSLKSTYINKYRQHQCSFDPLSDRVLNKQDLELHRRETERQMKLRRRLEACDNVFEFVLLNAQMLPNIALNESYLLLQKEHSKEKVRSMVRSNDRRVFDCFKELFAIHYIPRINIPIIAVQSKGDMLIRLKNTTRIEMLTVPDLVLIETNAGQHCFHKNSMFDIASESWIESAVFDLFRTFV